MSGEGTGCWGSLKEWWCWGIERVCGILLVFFLGFWLCCLFFGCFLDWKACFRVVFVLFFEVLGLNRIGILDFLEMILNGFGRLVLIFGFCWCLNLGFRGWGLGVVVSLGCFEFGIGWLGGGEGFGIGLLGLGG